MLIVLNQAIAYFLAGGFLIGWAISLGPNNGTPEPINWFTSVVGGILIVAGFAFALSTFPRLTDFFKGTKAFSFKRYIMSILFCVTATQVLKMIFDFREVKPLFVITIIFLIIVLSATMVTSRRIFQHTPSLLTSSLTFSILAIILTLIGQAEIIQAIILLALSFTLLLLAVLKRGKERQQKRVGFT